MFTETDSPNNLMCLYVLFIYFMGLQLQYQLGHEESHIFLCFSIAELCHSWSVLLVQVVPSNCFQGRTSSLCWLGRLCILTSTGSAVSPRPFLSSLRASAERVPVPSIVAVPSRRVALCSQLSSVFLKLWEGFQISSVPQYLRREQWWVLSPWDLPRCLPHSP